MNKLFCTRAYLCGAMDRVVDNGVTWRKKITPELHKLGTIVFDPCDKPTSENKEDNDNRILRKQLKKERKYKQLSEVVKPIRAVDLRMVDITDYTIVNIDINVHACGTYEELFLANREKKPILVHIEGGLQEAPDWLFAVLPYQMMFGSWDKLIQYLHNIDNGKDTRTFNRWQFFDFERVTKEMMAVYTEEKRSRL